MVNTKFLDPFLDGAKVHTMHEKIVEDEHCGCDRSEHDERKSQREPDDGKKHRHIG